MKGMGRPGPTVSLEAARAQLLATMHRLEPRFLPVDRSLGRVLARALVAAEDVSPFANAAMDGFAVRAEDVRTASSRLRLIGSVAAGRVADERVGPGQAMAITTGAPLPTGADAVCMVERAELDGDEIALVAPIAAGENVRYPGEDVAKGSVVFDPFTELTPAHIGVLASLGVRAVAVYPSLRVGVLSTGDELVERAGPLERGQIHDSNRHLLLALARSVGCEPVDLGVVGDDEAAINQALESAVGACDAILTSGGVSVGVADHMKKVLGRLSGGSVRWMEVAIRPAKPFGFATLAGSGLPVLCLPGNPVAAMVSFELLVRPALRLMMGHAVLERPGLLATAEEGLARQWDGKLHLVRVVVTADRDGRLHARPLTCQGSHQLRSMALANALALLPDGEGVGAGEPIRVLLLSPDTVPISEPLA